VGGLAVGPASFRVFCALLWARAASPSSTVPDRRSCEPDSRERRWTTSPPLPASPKGTLYLYFPSKTDLVAALRAEYSRELIERGGEVFAAPAAAGTAAKRLRRFVATMFDVIVANRDLHHMLFQEAGASEAEPFGVGC
jgi:hypothetical protein